jgi:hypothetical protein
MTVTVAQLIEALQKVPQEAVVQCLSHDRDYGTEWKDLTLDDLNVVDLRGNEFVKPDAPYYGKVFLEIGDK